MISPGSTSSLPVEITTIIGCALTRTRAMPAPAAMATSGARQPRAGGQQQRALAAVGAAAMHVLPGLHGGLRPISAKSPLRCTCSTGTTASQPRGSIAPVMISMQLDGSVSVCGGSPAACEPATRRRPALPGARPVDKRDAIHGHAIERRLVAFGVDVLAQHRARGLRERQRLDRQAREVLLDERSLPGRA